MSNSLGPHGLYSPWNSPGQNTGVGILSLLQGDLPNSGIEPMSLMSPALAGGFFTRATWKTCSMTTKVNNIAFNTENLLDFRCCHGKNANYMWR